MNVIKTNPMLTTYGLDVSDKFTEVYAVDASGELLEQGRLKTSREALRGKFGGLNQLRIVLEVGPHSRWISKLLGKLGHEVLVANPRSLRLIYASDFKDDKLDAQRLATLARVDPKLLGHVTHRPEDLHLDLQLVRSREILVRSRTKMVNHLRGVAKCFGLRLPKTSTDAFATRVLELLPTDLHPTVQPLVDSIAGLTSSIKIYDKQIAQLIKSKHSAECEILQQVAGVGPIISLAFRLVIQEPGRFRSSRSVGTYLGLVPRRDQSGESCYHGRITKAGSGLMRRLFIQAAHYVLGRFGPDCDLRRWGLARPAGNKIAKRKTVVAVARKLATLLHRLWLTGERYDPLRGANSRPLVAEGGVS